MNRSIDDLEEAANRCRRDAPPARPGFSAVASRGGLSARQAAAA